VFEGVHKNPFFIAINVIMVTGQVLIIFFGGSALSATRLSAKEWAISIFLGAVSMPVAILIRLIPDEPLRRILHVGVSKTRPRYEVSETSDISHWHQAVENVRYELRQPRSSRLGRVRHEIQAFFWAKIFGEDSEDEEAEERSPLLRHHSGQNRSRASSVGPPACAPAAVMAGLVAGGVAGWQPAPNPSQGTSNVNSQR
jgi:Ca2+-transporting ATPase